MPPNITFQADTLEQFEFLVTLAKDPSNTVIGLARDVSALRAKLEDAGLPEVHSIKGDVGDAASMKVSFALVNQAKTLC